MNNRDDPPIRRDLILVGGGHSHVLALPMLAMGRPRDLRITLISDSCLTPYSGMVPGVIAGHYTPEQAQIDLNRLCRAYGVRFINDRVTGLDPARKLLSCERHPHFSYETLSLDIGAVPDLSIPGALSHGITVKPMTSFLRRWDELQRRMAAAPHDRQWHIATVGGGASGVEVTLAMQRRLLVERPNDGGSAAVFHLMVADTELLGGHSAGVRQRFERVLAERGIEVHRNFRVARVRENSLIAADGREFQVDAVIWTVSANGSPWLADTGLRLDSRGFVEVDDYLRSVSHPSVFAAGDTAVQINHPRPRAGVFAVRQGMPLADNLLRWVNNQSLRPFRPQRAFLSLISTGDRFAVASRGRWTWSGRWVWRWKDRIDRRFMRRFDQDLPPVATASRTGQPGGDNLRCGGCGAKVGQSVLERVILNLAGESAPDTLVGLDHPDDAAVLRVPADRLLVQSVDAFRALVSDPWLFGQIAANHALGDLYAMGARPQSAQALVTLPYAEEGRLAEDLLQLMSGALRIFRHEGVSLVGGHTAEGTEMTLGFVVNGDVDPSLLWRKGGLKPGDRLILTKPLGSGILFAADMRHQARGRWIEAAVASMCQSHFAAAQLFRHSQVRACTDVTGFGLIGHLMEMLRTSGCTARLFLDRLPVFEGARESAAAGWLSSLHAENEKGRKLVTNAGDFQSHPLWPLLFDPQTAGGLLAGVPENLARSCLRRLRDAGYSQARIIGEVSNDGPPEIFLLP